MKPRFSTHLFHRVWETLVEKCEEAVRKDVPSILNQNLESESVLTLFQYPSGKGPTVNAKILPANRKSKHKMILFFKFWGFLRDSQTSPKANLHRATRGGFQKVLESPKASLPIKYPDFRQTWRSAQ